MKCPYSFLSSDGTSCGILKTMGTLNRKTSVRQKLSHAPDDALETWLLRLTAYGTYGTVGTYVCGLSPDGSFRSAQPNSSITSYNTIMTLTLSGL